MVLAIVAVYLRDSSASPHKTGAEIEEHTCTLYLPHAVRKHSLNLKPKVH